MTQLVKTGQQARASTPLARAATRSYLLCATPRTGSYLLADLLRQTERAGRPTEYFSFGYQQHWTQHWQTTTYSEYLQRVLHAGTTDNGVFAAKAHPRQLRNFAEQETGATNLGAAELRAALERWLPAPRYVWLRRHDELRQAISWAKSMQTNIWWDAQVAPAPFDAPVPEGLRFHFDFLTGALVRMRREDRMWERFFVENAITPHVVWYEDLAADPRAVFDAVVDFLDLPDLRRQTPGVPSLRRQSDATSERWLRRYVALTAARFEATFSACAGLERDHPDVLVTGRGLDRPAAWDEARHSLLAHAGYPGPFKADYLLGTPREAAGPGSGSGMSFVAQRSVNPAGREIVLPPRWLAALSPLPGLDERDARAVALAAHLGADRVGVVGEAAHADPLDVGRCRVICIDERAGFDIDGFLMAPARPAHERGAPGGRLIAIISRGDPPQWARSLSICVSMLTRHRCVLAAAGAEAITRADIVLAADGTTAPSRQVITVRESAGGMLELAVAGTARSVPQPVDWWSRNKRGRPLSHSDFTAQWDESWAPALAALSGAD